MRVASGPSLFPGGILHEINGRGRSITEPLRHHRNSLGVIVDEDEAAPELCGHRPQGSAAGKEIQHPVARVA